MERTKVKTCIINSNGPIAELGFITGPVLTPSRIEIDTIGKMVRNGKKVIEINPINKQETVLLTLDNFDKDNFGTAKKATKVNKVEEPKKVAEVVKEETPVEEAVETAGEESDEEKTEEPVVEETPVEEAKTESTKQYNKKSKKR